MSRIMGEATPAIEVFYSYAHKDEYWRKRLKTHLSTLQRQGLIVEWYDRDISAGRAWATEIDKHLNQADIILLLISPDFIASDYCYSIEATRAMERHHEGTARVVPIILHPGDLKGTSFASLQALPTNAKPITTWKDRNLALQNVAQGLRMVIEELHAQTDAPGTRAQTTLTLSASPLWNLPYRRNPFFTGREDLLNELHDYLTRAHTAAITQPPAITGLGGIGKTQLAIEYAYRYKQEYQSIFWVTAATRETLIEGFVSIAKLLQLPSKDDDEQLKTVSAVHQWLATHRSWLLILDNADNSTLVREFLPVTEHGHVLLTTREHAWGALAQSFAVEQMGQSEGTLFLLRRAKVLRSAESPLSDASSSDLTIAQAIVKALDGLPLALDQAGAYIEETPSTATNYLKAYERRQHELLHERGNEPGSHPDAVATTWSLNFEQVERLNPAAADVLRCLAFLAPDAIPEEIVIAGAAELGPHLQALASDETLLDPLIKILTRFSLVQRNPHTLLLFIHRLVQAIFKATMTDETQYEWAERTVRAVERALPEISVETREQWERLLPHALVCAELINEYSLAQPEAARLLSQTGYYMNHYVQPTQALPLYEHALAIREQVLGPTHPDTASSLNNLAVLYHGQGNDEQARLLLERALAIRE